MSYKNSHPRTYQYMQSAINLGITCIEDFNLAQQQEILSELFEELDDSWKDALLNDSPVNKTIGKKMIVFGYARLSEGELYDIRLEHVGRYWENVNNLLDDIFDEAHTNECNICQESEEEENLRSWRFERSQEAQDLNKIYNTRRLS